MFLLVIVMIPKKDGGASIYWNQIHPESGKKIPKHTRT